MEIDPQTSLPQTPPTSQIGKRQWWGMSLLALAALVASCLILRDAAQIGLAQDRDDNKDKPQANLFIGWKKPDLAIVVSGQMQGYIQPCGCSDPQKGGLARRYNFMQALKDKGWPVTAVDLGDIAQVKAPEQRQQRLKYIVSMKALKLMGYQAIGIGKNEFTMPLTDALANYSIDIAKPRPVAANLIKTDKGDLFHQLNVRKGEVFQAGNIKVGVLGCVSPDTAKDIGEALGPKEDDIKFLNEKEMLSRALATLAQPQFKVDIGVLLYQGQEAEALECAAFLHEQHLKNPKQAPVQILLCLTQEEEPPSFPRKDPKSPDTSIITIGHKGRYVGVVGLWKKEKGFDIKYQLVAMGPEFKSKPVPEKDNPVMELMEKYAEEVRAGNFLARFPRDTHPMQATLKTATYVGTELCAGCHQEAENVWAKSRHAGAYKSLVNDTNPKLRQFDGECIVCHTVGFKYHTGYFDPPKEANEKQIQKHNAKLLNVGCESCHGPGSEHANNPNNKTFYPLINPYRASEKELDPQTPMQVRTDLLNRRHLRIDGFCQKCHDPENDVHWGEVPFQQKWDMVAHPTLKKGVNAVQAK